MSPTSTSTWTTWAADSAASSPRTCGASKPRSFPRPAAARPVKLFLDRATELTIAGNRPSVFAKVKIGAKKDGTITAWQSEDLVHRRIGRRRPERRSCSRTSSRKFPTAASTTPPCRINTGGARAWRAPNHPQASYITCSALEDLAAKLHMDPLDFFLKNLDHTIRGRPLPAPVREGRRTDRLEEELAPARRFRPRHRQARPRPRPSAPGAARGHASTVPHHHPSGRHGRSRTGYAGSRHRHPHHDRDGRRRNLRPAE